MKANLLHLSMIAFVVVSSVTLDLQNEVKAEPQIIVEEVQVLSPTLTNVSDFPLVSAESVVAIDMDSGHVLYEKSADMPLLPASTAKMITALVSFDYYPERFALTVGREVNVVGQKMGLVVGERIFVEDLARGLLVFSANDAAEVLAANYPGGKAQFINSMNLKAMELGLDDSYFVSPAGLDGVRQKTTANDLVKLASKALTYERFSETVSLKEIGVRSVDGKVVHNLANTNELLGEVEGVLGVKTGWTENAKENLVTYVKRDEKKVLIALLGSQDRFGETEELIEWLFTSYVWP